jgi:hypothetical protein
MTEIQLTGERFFRSGSEGAPIEALYDFNDKDDGSYMSW